MDAPPRAITPSNGTRDPISRCTPLVVQGVEHRSFLLGRNRPFPFRKRAIQPPCSDFGLTRSGGDGDRKTARTGRSTCINRDLSGVSTPVSSCRRGGRPSAEVPANTRDIRRKHEAHRAASPFSGPAVRGLWSGGVMRRKDNTLMWFHRGPFDCRSHAMASRPSTHVELWIGRDQRGGAIERQRAGHAVGERRRVLGLKPSGSTPSQSSRF